MNELVTGWWLPT